MDLDFNFTWIDNIVFIILVSSCILSALRGLIYEISSLVVWVIAIYCAYMFGNFVADALPGDFSIELKKIFGFLILLIIVLVISKLIVLSLKETVLFFGGGQIDRFFGAIFGILRGLLIILVLSILGSMTALPNERAWKEAKVRDYLERSIEISRPFLPNFLRLKIILPKKVEEV